MEKIPEPEMPGGEQPRDAVINNGGLTVRPGEAKQFGSLVVGEGASIENSGKKGLEEMDNIDREMERELAEAGLKERAAKGEARKKRVGELEENLGVTEKDRVQEGTNAGIKVMENSRIIAGEINVTGGGVEVEDKGRIAADTLKADSLKMTGNSRVEYGKMNVPQKNIGPEASVVQKPAQKKNKGFWGLFR